MERETPEAQTRKPVDPEVERIVPSGNSTGFTEERQELEWLLAHPEIARSASLVRFLSFICNRYFDGEAAEIREFSIAVEALGRKPASFDSHVDPIVRVTARSLRKKLQDIYAKDGAGRPLRIVLPLGHYVPQFIRQGEQENPVADSIKDDSLALPKAGGIESDDAAPAAQHRDPFRGFVVRNRLLIVNTLLVAVLLSAVFVAGFFLGKRSDRQVQTMSPSPEWGDPVWSDEFNGSAQQAPDTSKWTFDTGNPGDDDRDIQIYCAPTGVNPRECDSRHPNVFEDGSGHLVLRAEKTASGVWTSARMTTRGLKSFQYGRIEARLRFPVGTGLWPSLWMLGSDFPKVGWPASGSVDIAESSSYTLRTNGLGPNMIRSVVHGPRYFGGNGLWRDFKLPNGGRVDDTAFHSYGMIWSPGMIQFYVDDPSDIFFVLDSTDIPAGGEWVFDKPFDLFLNLAVGGIWPGNPDSSTPNPADLVVDYIRVYKIPQIPAPTIQWQPVRVKSGNAVASIINLQAHGYAGRVHLACTTDPAIVGCTLATPIVDFSETLQQQDTLTLSTESFSDKGKTLAPSGRYRVTITAITISGDRSQIVAPFDVIPAN